MDADLLIALARAHQPLPRTLSTRTRNFLLNLEENLAKLTAAILPTGSSMPPRPSLNVSEQPSSFSSHPLSPGVRSSEQHAGPIPFPRSHLRLQAEEMTSSFTPAMLPSGRSMPPPPPLILSEQPFSINSIPTNARSYKQPSHDSSRPLAEEMTPTFTAAMLPQGRSMPLPTPFIRSAQPPSINPTSPGARSPEQHTGRVPFPHRYFRPQAEEMTPPFTAARLPSGCSMPPQAPYAGAQHFDALPVYAPSGRAAVHTGPWPHHADTVCMPPAHRAPSLWDEQTQASPIATAPGPLVDRRMRDNPIPLAPPQGSQAEGAHPFTLSPRPTSPLDEASSAKNPTLIAHLPSESEMVEHGLTPPAGSVGDEETPPPPSKAPPTAEAGDGGRPRVSSLPQDERGDAPPRVDKSGRVWLKPHEVPLWLPVLRAHGHLSRPREEGGYATWLWWPRALCGGMQGSDYPSGHVHVQPARFGYALSMAPFPATLQIDAPALAAAARQFADAAGYYTEFTVHYTADMDRAILHFPTSASRNAFRRQVGSEGGIPYHGHLLHLASHGGTPNRGHQYTIAPRQAPPQARSAAVLRPRSLSPEEAYHKRTRRGGRRGHYNKYLVNFADSTPNLPISRGKK